MMNERARTCAYIEFDDDLYMSLSVHTIAPLSVCMHCVLLYRQERVVVVVMMMMMMMMMMIVMRLRKLFFFFFFDM
jgi:hypothetical protein